MKFLSFPFLLVIAVGIGNIHANCPLSQNPTDLAECLTYIGAGIYGIAVQDLKKICRIASDIARCASDQMGQCIGAQVGKAALAEVENTARYCCPDRNNINCPIRDANVQEQRCFSADSLVTLADGNRKTVAQLRSGDSVLAFNHDTKTILPTQLITMLDFQPQRFALFKHITTASGRQLSLSSSHLLFTTTDDYIMAKDIRIGMEVLVMNENNELINDRVSNVSDVVKQGYIAPLTVEGTMIVNDVAASCYSTIKSHRIAHAVLSPMRFWYRWFGSEQQKDEVEEGIHWFPKMIYEATTYILPSIIQK